MMTVFVYPNRHSAYLVTALFIVAQKL